MRDILKYDIKWYLNHKTLREKKISLITFGALNNTMFSLWPDDTSCLQITTWLLVFQHCGRWIILTEQQEHFPGLRLCLQHKQSCLRGSKAVQRQETLSTGESNRKPLGLSCEFAYKQCSSNCIHPQAD